MGVWSGGNPRKLWQAYCLAVGLLITLLLGGHLLHFHELEAGEDDAKVVDQSGRQRMLAQRIVGMVQMLHDLDVRDRYATTIRMELARFRTTHKRLVDVASNYPRAHAVYDPGNLDGLDMRSQDFVAHVRDALVLEHDDPELKELQQRIATEVFTSLRSHLERAVRAFSNDATDRVQGLVALQAYALSMSLFVLAMEALFIFWPAQRTVNRALDTAERRTREAEARNVELQELSERLEYAAHHDELTGLANRSKLHADLERRLTQSDEPGADLFVMHVDLDRFKEINDALGHPVGDKLLARVADVMRSKVGPHDLVSRVGGDEFVIVCNRPDDEDPTMFAQHLAEVLIASIRAPMLIDGNTCMVGASVGYSFAEGEASSAERLIGNADVALYEAKRAGKGVAVKFEPSMRSGIERRHALIQDIERAIDTNEFVPFFQPKVALSDGRVVGFEVLTRWLHPTRGILPPADFLSIAEETGLIDTIDYQAAMGGLEALRQVRKLGWEDLRLAVNASGSSLRNPDYAVDFEMAVAMRGLEPKDVTIEVIETTVISDVGDQAIGTLTALAAKGFMVDIDDFGTGYASLAMLSKLNLTGVKIDRELTANLHEPRGRQIVEAVIGLAKALKLEIVAEGVEEVSQFESLRSMGCDVAQGFGVGRPMSVADTIAWLETYDQNRVIASA